MEGAVSNKKWYDSPKGQATTKTYRKSPHRKARVKELRETPEYKAKAKALAQTPAVKASVRASRGKRTKIAARGNFTASQWLERLSEFGSRCAYCTVQLLTTNNGVDLYHPHYQTMDHIIALLCDGQHTKANIIPACRGCNNSKLNKDVWVWMKEKSIAPSDKLLPILQEATQLHQETINPSET